MGIRIQSIAIAALMVGTFASCSTVKKIYGLQDANVPLTMTAVSVPSTYRNLDKEVKLEVKSIASMDEIYDDSALSGATKTFMPKYTFVPSIQQFCSESTRGYMQQMGFDVSQNANDKLIIEVKTFKMYWIDKKSAGAKVVLNYKMVDEAGETVVPQATASSSITFANTEQFGMGLGRAYADALSKINWDRIADQLRIAKTAKQEKNAKVTGAGDTALEHTVIRWFINSSPQGADVSWRVVSSTPDVSNTNSNYVGTTPYETTESFDIKGMTYNNSGNIQIEVTCERSGYLPQRKRFNLRQAIDQKEISAKFNLVKDD